MTGLLKDVLQERAERLAPPRADLDTIIADGHRRVRRLRRAGAAAVAAAVALVATVAPFALGDWRDAETPVSPAAPRPFQDPEVSFAVGSTIQHGDRSIDVDSGLQLASYVQTDDGFVFATRNGEVHFTDGDQTTSIGTTSRDGLYLKSGDTGSYAAWVEFPEGNAPVFVVYDTSEMQRVVETSEGNRADMGSFRDSDAAYVYAVDGGNVYWRSGQGAVRYDIATGKSEVLAAGADPSDVLDVANGRIAHRLSGSGNDGPLRVGASVDDAGTRMRIGWNGSLSPAGTYVAVEEADEMAVFASATGKEVTPQADGYAFTSAYGWLDDDTVLVLGVNQPFEKDLIDILTCEIPAGDCSTAVKDAATIARLTIPVGESFR